MIGPVPHAGPVPPEGRGDSADPQHGEAPSDLFAQLLGAGGMLAGGQGMPGDLPSPSAPDAAMLAPGQDAAAKPGQQESAPLAHRFNQNGFFGHAGETPELAVTLAREDAGPAEPWNPAAPAGQVAGPRPDVAVSTRGSAGTISRSDAAQGLAMRAAGAGPDSAEARPTGAAVAAPAPIEEAEAADPAAPLERRAHRPTAAARSALHVALRELESGLQVAARVEGLDEAERHQLRDEIAALLGRHGLSAARIRINAMPPRESER